MFINIRRIFKFIRRHPLNTGRGLSSFVPFLRWQLFSRLIGLNVIFPWVDDARLIVGKGVTTATGNIYVGLMEFEEMGFVLHYLRPNEIFFDIGANIGTYTILSSKVVGCKSVAIEPGRTAFERLLDNLRINRIDYLVTPICAAVGSRQGNIGFSTGMDSKNFVQLRPRNKCSDRTVPISTLDDIVNEEGLSPHVIKMDVEGFESEVISGAHNTIASPGLNAVLMELRGHGSRYGFNETEVHCFMRANGFQACEYNPLTRRLSKRRSHLQTLGDMLYIRDLSLARERVDSSKKYRVHNRLL